MIYENKIIFFINKYNKHTCSHLKGLLIFKLNKILDDLCLIDFSNNIYKLYENNKFNIIENPIFKNNKLIFIKFLHEIQN